MRTRFLIWGTGIWLTATLLLLVFMTDLENAIWILSYGVLLAMLLLGVCLLIFSVFCLRRSLRATCVCALLIIGGIAFSLTAGPAAGDRMRFMLMRPYYERQLHEVLQSYEAGRIEALHYYPKYVVDSGPPVRVAFIWVGGVTDNWVGLVYDPTGMVMQANQFKRDWSNWNEPKRRSVKNLFGGDLLHARHLQGYWYICAFT